MKFLIAIVIACFAQSALSSWAGHGAYHGGWAGAGAYHGPLAAPVVTPSGFLADTPEVAAAKAAHFAEVAKAGAGAGVPYAAGYAGAGAYHGPLAAPVVTPSGFLADTPEVAAAKAAHLSLLSHAGAAAGAPYAGAWAGPYAGAGAGHWAGAGHYADPNESGQYVPSHNEGQYVPDQNHW